MRLRPRYYQEDAVASLYTYFGKHTGNPVIAMPTGTGKSVVIAMFLESIFTHFRGQRVVVLTHVKELIEQNHGKLIDLWPAAPAGIYSAGLGRKDALRPIMFAGIASVAKKHEMFGHVDLVIIDEAHLVGSNQEAMYQAFLGKLLDRNPKLKVIGLTATPYRLGMGSITRNGIFTDICYDITKLEHFNRLVREGYLAPLVPKKTGTELDLTGVHRRGGEFIEKELQEAVDREEVTRAALEETIAQSAGRKAWLIFASGVQHARNIAHMLNSMGVPTVAITGDMTKAQRDDAIADFKAGKYLCAVNNNVLTTGFDYPAIDLIVMLRPTESPGLWVQMLGRGTRPFATKLNCLVLDFAGNTARLGPINDPILPREPGSKGTGEAPVKVCSMCASYVHASVPVCEYCGYEFPKQVKIQHVASTAELIRDDSPVVEVFAVTNVTYHLHQKEGKPDMVKVNYVCGLRMFSEWVCFEHGGFARRKAEQWWKARETVSGVFWKDPVPCPATTAEALELVELLPKATHIRVWVNKQYPELLAHCFDGSAFGAIQQDAEIMQA